MELRDIPLDEIDIEHNVRTEDIEVGLDELAQNIKKIGLQQPVVVFKKKDNRYELIIGQRRYLAIKKLNWPTIPAIITPFNDETDIMIKSFSDNIHRLDLTYRDKNRVVTQLKEKYKNDDEIAKMLGISVQTVRKYLGYSAVPEEVKKLVDQRKLGANTAIRITQSITDERKAVEIAKKVIEAKTSDFKGKIIDAARENPERTTEEIVHFATKRAAHITIHLTDTIDKALKKATEVYNSSREDITKDALEEWLKQRGFIQ